MAGGSARASKDSAKRNAVHAHSSDELGQHLALEVLRPRLGVHHEELDGLARLFILSKVQRHPGAAELLLSGVRLQGVLLRETRVT